jgi:hypothetical protein
MAEEKTGNSLDMLKTMADKDLHIDKSSLDTESLRTPKLHNKWIRMLYDRKERLQVLEWKRKILVKDKWLYYNGKASDEVYKEKGPFQMKVLKGDLNMFIEADTDFHKLEAQMFRVKNELDFIQKTIEELNRRSFHISNSLKALSFMNGMNV